MPSRWRRCSARSRCAWPISIGTWARPISCSARPRAASPSSGALKTLREHAEREREALLARARAEIAQGRDAREVLDRLAHALTNKLLHLPTINLRAAALRGDAELLRAAERLFGEGPQERP